jgi:outer membrane protein TolC
LTIQDAIQLSLRNNLSTLLAAERQVEARGQQTQARASLMPNLSATISQTNRTENLAALGLDSSAFPAGIRFPTFIGPFNVFDARLNLAQSLFDLNAIRQYQASKAAVKVADFQVQLAREQISASAALSYLNAIRSERSVQAAQANLDLAQALLTLAQNQRAAGIATGVDVTRAQTRVAQEQVRVAQAQTQANQTRLQLLRVAGLPLDATPTLTDPLRFVSDSVPSEQTAVSTAEQRRPEILIAQEQVRVSELETSAARAEHLPSVDLLADYGSSGITPTNSNFPTREIGVRVNVPVFNGGLTTGRIRAAESRRRQAQLQLTDVRKQVEQDVRDALLTLGTSAEQVRAADQSFTLAERELQMSRDRFSAGVGDNIEVINAQTALANARDAQVEALTQYNAARINLSAALGRAEEFRW